MLLMEFFTIDFKFTLEHFSFMLFHISQSLLQEEKDLQ